MESRGISRAQKSTNHERVPSTCKQATASKCAKMCNRLQGRENRQRASGVRKHATGSKRVKTCYSLTLRKNNFGFAPD